MQPLQTKLVLQKRRAKEGRSSDDIENPFAIPSSVTVKKSSPYTKGGRTKLWKSKVDGGNVLFICVGV